MRTLPSSLKCVGRMKYVGAAEVCAPLSVLVNSVLPDARDCNTICPLSVLLE